MLPNIFTRYFELEPKYRRIYMIETQKTITFKTAKDITIVANAFGNPTDTPVLLLHGGGQTRHSWKKTGERIADQGWYVIAPDARGHGDSSWSSQLHYSFTYIAQDLQHIINSLDQKPVLIGASMGGLTSMMVLAQQPTTAKALILVDVSPKLEKKGVDRIFKFMAANPEGYESIEAVQTAIASYLPHRKNRGSATGLRKSLRRLPNGNYGWHWDPKILEVWQSLSSHRDPSEFDGLFNEVLKKLTIPSLLVRGGISDVVSKETVKELLAMAPHLKYVNIKDAGHMIAGDSNDIFTNALLRFLKQIR